MDMKNYKVILTLESIVSAEGQSDAEDQAIQLVYDATNSYEVGNRFKIVIEEVE